MGSHVPPNPILKYRTDFGRGEKKVHEPPTLAGIRAVDSESGQNEPKMCVPPKNVNWSRMPIVEHY